jgi:enterochelin esterase-like enzyme
MALAPAFPHGDTVYFPGGGNTMSLTLANFRLLALTSCLLFSAAIALQAQQAAKPAAPAPTPAPAFKPSPNDLLVVPEIAPDNRVTFKLFAPEAKSVNIRGEWLNFPEAATGTPLAKGEDGVWSTTLTLKPGAYRYFFSVDGLTVADPRNPNHSQSLNFVQSLITVPGLDFLDTKPVPHGTIETVYYESKTLGATRRMHIYTPPGYEKDSARYPVFYLLHGAGDSDDSWSTVGRAGFIMDNLIAAGKAKRMIVVMPAGHVDRNFVWGDHRTINVGQFERDFTSELLPFVEAHYRVGTDRNQRAIAGLSMGGLQTLNIFAADPNRFAYVGVFSSGWIQGIADDAESQFRAGLDDANAKKGLKLVWFATGTDDFLMPSTRKTLEILKSHGFQPEFHESAGGHTWQNWQDYLRDFAPRLFE